MYERFTDRARKVMQLANREAQLLNHDYIGTEHILLGLIAETTGGTSATILKRMGIGTQKIVEAINNIVISGPEMTNAGTRPQTPNGKKVIDYAAEEALKLNHNYIGTEHLLLGLLRDLEGETVAGMVLRELGLTLVGVRALINSNR